MGWKCAQHLAQDEKKGTKYRQKKISTQRKQRQITQQGINQQTRTDQIITWAKQFFNKSLQTGVFPEDWKLATISPILKPGKDPVEPKSYRPVALLSCVSKVFERLVHEQLFKFCFVNGILPDEQYGFVKGRSAEWQLLSVLEKWHISLDNHHHVHSIFVDAAKAFDRVDHTILLETLSSIGVGGISLQWFHSYLSNRLIQTKVEAHVSKAESITSGVPQGSVLGPLLFLLHFKDIPAAVSAPTELFADDTLLYRRDCRLRSSSHSLLWHYAKPATTVQLDHAEESIY